MNIDNTNTTVVNDDTTNISMISKASVNDKSNEHRICIGKTSDNAQMVSLSNLENVLVRLVSLVQIIS